MGKVFLALTAFVVLEVSAGAATVMDIETCGAVVPARVKAVVTVDLTCSSGAAVTLQRGAQLDLAGHTITLGLDGLNTVYGVYCEGNCRVISNSGAPGAIVGPGAATLAPIGILVKGNARLENLLFQGLRTGTIGSGRLRAKYVTAVGNQWGIGVWSKMTLENVDAYGNIKDGIGVSRVLRARYVSVHDNGGIGIQCPDRVHAEHLSIADNGSSGICGKAVVFRDSNLGGNGASDLYTGRRPRLFDTTCETSQRSGSTLSWRICSLD